MRPPTTTATTPRSLAVVLAVGLALAGCGGTDPAGPDATASPLPGATAPASPGPTTGPATDAPTDAPTDDPTAAPTADALAGEPHDGPPVHGQPAVLAVVGVAADDVLHVRAGPGTDEEVLATLPPLARDVAATGRARRLTSSIWLELEVDGTTGWASSSFLAYLGPTDDVTARMVEQGGPLPSAATMAALGEAVAARLASDDPPSTVVVSAGPSVGDLGEVTVDVVGLGDDAVRALRVVVFAEPTDDGFTTRTVEATTFCGRGPAVDEACP